MKRTPFLPSFYPGGAAGSCPLLGRGVVLCWGGGRLQAAGGRDGQKRKERKLETSEEKKADCRPFICMYSQRLRSPLSFVVQLCGVVSGAVRGGG